MQARKTESDATSIGARIESHRKRLGLSREQLAKAVRSKPHHVQRWESGRNPPRATDIVALCELFSVSAEELLGLQTKLPVGKWIRDLDKKEKNDAALAIGAVDGVFAGEFLRVPADYELLSPEEAAPLMEQRTEQMIKARERRTRARRGASEMGRDVPRSGDAGSLPGTGEVRPPA